MPEVGPRPASHSRLTPRRVFGVLAILVVIATLLAPLPEDRDAPALSSLSHQPSGARGLYESLERLGFDVSRRTTPMRDGSLADTVHWIVLAPTVEITSAEAHNLLDAVRSGAGLLLVPSFESRLGDSLGIRRAPAVPRSPRGFARPTADSTLLEPADLVQWVLRPADEKADSGRILKPRAGAVRLLDAETREGREPVALGLHFGSGRILVAAADELFTNASVREIGPAVRAVRLIEWLDGATARPLVFDEYHHGYGTHADVLGVASRALVRTSPGRMLIQLAIAGLALLLAVANRPIRPVAQGRLERRSPLEHVDALARAYAAVGARSRATRLLVRGLRRRHGGPRAERDEKAWLTSMVAERPTAGTAAQRLVAGIDGNDRSGSEEALAAAILQIEEVIGP